MNKFLKHIETRCLSVGRCLNKVIKLWEPLFSFFEKETEAKSTDEVNLDSYRMPKIKKLLLIEDVGQSYEKPEQLAKNKVSDVERESFHGGKEETRKYNAKSIKE